MNFQTKFGNLFVPSCLCSFRSLLDWINLSTLFYTDINFFNRYIDEFSNILKTNSDRLSNSRFIELHQERNVWVHKNSKILQGVIIDGPCLIGPSSVIGPNTYIRPGTIVGEKVRLGHCVEVNSSVICNNVQLRHMGYVGKSIIGESSKVGAGTVFSTMRNDDKFIKIHSPNRFIKTHLHKVGSFVEMECRIGINVSIMPGTWIRKYNKIYPSSIANGLI